MPKTPFFEVSDVLIDLDDTISPFNGKDYFWDGLIRILIEKFEISSTDAEQRIADIVKRDERLGDPNNIYQLGEKFGVTPEEQWDRAMLYLEKNSFCYYDAVEMILTLYERGYRLHLATNRFGLWLDTRLAAAGLGDKNGSKYFDHYFTACRGYGCKLDDGYYRGILAELNVPADKVVMIGDSIEQDLYKPNEAGIMNVILVDRAQKKNIVVTDAVYVNSLKWVGDILYHSVDSVLSSKL